MKHLFQKPFRWALLYSLLLTLSAVYVLLDTFVIPRASISEPLSGDSISNTPLEMASSSISEAAPEASAPVITEHSYKDGNIEITIETERVNDTTFYVADIRLSDPTLLKTALAQDTYGRNIKENTTVMAQKHNAILAVNGDYYGFRDNGFVLRNGTLYRTEPRNGTENDSLVIDAAGNLQILQENESTAQILQNFSQAFSFGPALVENGNIMVDESDEVGQSKKSNPRTAIGQAGALHYIIIVSDGRTEESAGLSLLDLAREFVNRGCSIAYNLDGGGSSTMVFQEQLVNHPAGGRKSSKERAVSDIVYIGY